MTKVVLIDEGAKIRALVTGPTGPEHRRVAGEVVAQSLRQSRLSFEKVDYLLATGYGRINVPFADSQKSELICHARGVSFLFPHATTAIDIGGQDAKGLKIKGGELIDFVMNDRCAAGTGRFLEVLARRLGLKAEDLGSISSRSSRRIPVASTCTVFAEHEVISYLSRGLPLADIVAGLHEAIAVRSAKMIAKLRVGDEIVFTGGVAKNQGVVEALRNQLKTEVLVPYDPLITGALGAALLGREIVMKGNPVSRKERSLE